MNMLQKQLLGWAGFGVLVLLSFFLAVQTNQAWNTATTSNTVSFSGEGKVTAKPDVGVIDLSIVTQSATSKTAQDDNSRKSKTVTDFLKKQGIDDADIKTVNYNIYPQYDYSSGKSTVTGYQVTQTIEVKVRDLTKVGDILNGVVAAGANQIGQVQFTVDDPQKLQDEARMKAIEDAKSKASRLEHQLGIDLGRLVNFSEGTNGYPVPMYAPDMMGRGGGMGGGVVPSIPTGENEIVVTVTLTYQIK